MKPFPVSTLASIALLLVPVGAQESILPYLPQKTILAIGAPDLSMSVDEFAKMPLAKMWAEEEVQNFFGDVREMVAKKIEEGMAQAKEMHAQGVLPFDPEQLLKLRLKGGAFAVTHLELAMGDSGPLPKIGLVLHLDFGESAPTWNALLQMGLGMMEAQAGEKVTKTEAKIGEVALLSFRPNDAEGIEMGLHIAMVPGGVVIGTLVDDLRSIVENMQQKTPVLAASPAYQATAKHLDTKGAECEFYLQINPIIEFSLSALRLGASMNKKMKVVDLDGVERAVQAMGLRQLGSIGSTSNYVDGTCISKTYGARPGTATTAATKSIDTSFLKWVPKDAVSFSASTMNATSIYDTLLVGLQAYDPEFAKQALGQLAEIEQQLGFNVRDDLFGSLGDHCVSWWMPMATISSAPEIAFLMKVNSEEKIVKVLKSLAQLSDGLLEIEEGEKRGLKAYQIRINYEPPQGFGGINPLDMFQPTFAFKGGYLVGAFSASDVKRVFQRMDREDDPKNDIRSNKEFAAIARTLPAGVDSVSFTDCKAQFESIYQIATGLLAFVPVGEDLPIDMSLLPDSGTLTKHLFGSLSYSRSDASGTESVSIGPFGPEVALGFAAVVAAGVVVGGVAGRRGF